MARFGLQTFAPGYGDPNDEDLLSLLDGGGYAPVQQQPPAAEIPQQEQPDPVIQRAALGQSWGGPSLHDEGDQDLEATLLHDPSMRASVMQRPAAAQAAPPPAIASNQDPELEQAQRAAQMHALKQSMYDPHDYGMAELARDALPALIAGGFDAAFNHGRGALGILQTASTEAGHSEEQRQKQALQAGELATKLRGSGKAESPFDQWYKTQSIMDRQQGRGLQAQGEQGRNDRFDKRREDINDPESQRNTTQVSQRELTAAAGKRGAINQAHELVDTQAADAAQIAGGRTSATTNAETDALRANPRALTADQEIDNSRDQQTIDLKNQNAALVADRDKRDATSKFEKDIGNYVEVAKSARALQAAFKASPNDLPGVGQFDSRKPDWARSKADQDVATQLNTMRSFQQGPITGSATGGKAEEGRINELAGSTLGADEQAVQSAVDNLADIATARLRSHAVGREDVAREVLAKHGLDDLIGPAAAAPGAVADPGTQPNLKSSIGRSSLAPGSPGELGRSPVAQQPAFGGGGQTVRLKLPSGRVISASLTPEQLQKALAGGAEQL